MVCNITQNATVSSDSLRDYPVVGYDIIAYVGSSLSIIECVLVFVMF